MTRIMLDLETTGTTGGCGILSIGAVRFCDEKGLGDQFYRSITRESCRDIGLKEDPSTLQWWDQQSEEARSVFTCPNRVGIHNALSDFAGFFNEVPGSTIYGNGADFDNAILATAYTACRYNVPWRWQSRCYRTLKCLPEVLGLKEELFLPQGPGGLVKHNALDDAIWQAQHAIEIIKFLKPLLSL